MFTFCPLLHCHSHHLLSLHLSFHLYPLNKYKTIVIKQIPVVAEIKLTPSLTYISARYMQGENKDILMLLCNISFHTKS